MTDRPKEDRTEQPQSKGHKKVFWNFLINQQKEAQIDANDQNFPGFDWQKKWFYLKFKRNCIII